jgi:Transposase, Mutator family
LKACRKVRRLSHNGLLPRSAGTDQVTDAAKAEKLIRNLAQRLERDAPGVSKSILEGLDEILTVSRLGLPAELRRSLACTNIIENMMGTVRRVTRNVKRWSSPSMALRWTAAAMNEAKKGFRRLKAYKQLPALRVALAAHYEKETNNRALVQTAKAALRHSRQRSLHKVQQSTGQFPALSGVPVNCIWVQTHSHQVGHPLGSNINNRGYN